jgi:hypothetical protein
MPVPEQPFSIDAAGVVSMASFGHIRDLTLDPPAVPMKGLRQAGLAVLVCFKQPGPSGG